MQLSEESRASFVLLCWPFLSWDSVSHSQVKLSSKVFPHMSLQSQFPEYVSNGTIIWEKLPAWHVSVDTSEVASPCGLWHVVTWALCFWQQKLILDLLFCQSHYFLLVLTKLTAWHFMSILVGVTQDWNWIFFLLLFCDPGQVFHFSELQFLYLYNWINNTDLIQPLAIKWDILTSSHYPFSMVTAQ